MTFLMATLSAFFLLGAAIVLGGTAALSFAVAPRVFRLLGPEDADRVFGQVLAVFDRIGLVAAIVACVAAAVAAAVAGVTTAIVIMAVLMGLIAASFAWLRAVLFPRMQAVAPPPAEKGGRLAWAPAAKDDFHRMHKRYVAHYAAHLFLSTAAIVLGAA